MSRLRAFAFALALIPACSLDEHLSQVAPTDAGGGATTCAADDGAGLPLLGTDCDPLVPTQCGFPFPSNVYLQAEPFSKTGKRVVFGQTTLQGFSYKAYLDPLWWKDNDGFSAAATLMTHLPGATAAGLPTQDDLGASLDAASRTVLIDAETGERVPHFSEIDMSQSDDDPLDRAFLVRPVVRLKDGARYIVAVRGVVDADGKPIAPSDAFKALRDGSASCDVSVARRRALYDDIFSRLDKAGVKKDDLQIAWDFSTSSKESNTKRMIHMRDDALAKVGHTGPEYTVASVEENPNPYIRRRLHVMMNVPNYMNQPGPGARMMVDAQGQPIQNGYAQYEVLVHIPNAATKGTPGALLQNGHGLLGHKEEGQDGYLAEMADRHNYVAFSVDLIGMAHDDFTVISEGITSDVGKFVASVDRQHQGLLNSLLAMRLMSGAFANDPLTIIDGNKTIDTEHRYYRGDSQGGIFGTTYMSISTDVQRGLLGEPGLPYSLLLNRSADFGAYMILLRGALHNSRAMQLVVGLLQMIWDRTEPAGYVSYLADGTAVAPGAKPIPHQVLLHVAIGDQQVTPLGAHIIARTVGAKNLSPVNRSIWGIPEDPGPITGSAMVEFDFHNKESPKTNVPPDSTYGEDPHDEVRKMHEAMDQSDEFFRTGIVKPTCTGPCDPN